MMASESASKALEHAEVTTAAFEPPPPSYEEATISDKKGSSLPRPSEVVAHLKLLFAFHKLKEIVLNDSSLFGIDHSWLYGEKAGCTQDALQIRQFIADKRWDVFVQRAVLRFESWWTALRGDSNWRKITVRDVFRGKPFRLWNDRIKDPLTIDHLPPLDVLMVWHSFLLSPRRYLEDCLLQGMMPLWCADFPWAVIAGSICDESGEYDPGQDSVAAFEAMTQRKWSNADDTCDRQASCPRCGLVVNLTCTTFSDHIESVKTLLQEDLVCLEPHVSGRVLHSITAKPKSSKGWTDTWFSTMCPACKESINRDVLCGSKFRKDFLAYASKSWDANATVSLPRLFNQSPMPGSILNPRSGLPQGYSDASTTLQPETFPIVLADILSRVARTGKSPMTSYNLDGLRRGIEATMKNTDHMSYFTKSKYRYLQQGTKQAVRRMMSYYNDNPFMFALDLTAAVKRQGNFIQKMQQIDWLHSPAISSTSSRVILKYGRMLQVMAAYPAEMAVPTLDIDLAWHTHQLSPHSYFKYTTLKTARFIDHDDKVSEYKLSESFARTSKNYQKMFAEPYSECTCWYCEAVHASVVTQNSVRSLFSRTPAYRRPESCPSDQTAPHISTHNAVRVVNPPTGYKLRSRNHLIWLEKAYQRACVRAKKEGRPEPARRHPGPGSESQSVDEKDRDRYAASAYAGDMSFGYVGGKGKVAAVGALGFVGVGVGVTVIAFTAEGDLSFEGQPEEVDDRHGGGGGGCVTGTCGGGVAYGACSGDVGAASCGVGGVGSCGGGDGGGCGGGGCGGCGGG